MKLTTNMMKEAFEAIPQFPPEEYVVVHPGDPRAKFKMFLGAKVYVNGEVE